MNSPDLSPSPEDVIADLEARAERVETPCDGGTMVWRGWGAGPPVVLLHGSHGAWSHWVRNIDVLARTYRVWAPDLPGCGDSDMPASEDGDHLGEILAAGLHILLPAGGSADVVGFSMGGVVGAHLAAVAPELVRRLVIVDSGGLDTPWEAPRLVRVRGLEGEALREAHRTNLLGLMIHHPRNADDLAVLVQGRNTLRGRLRGYDLVMPDKLVKLLPRVAAQVDAIWAEHDFVHPAPEVQLAAIRLSHPDCTLRVVADAGHWVMYEGAAGFNAAVGELLAEGLR